MTAIDAVREVQIPLLSAMLLAGCAAKLARMLRARSAGAALGPAALFPMHMRRPAAVLLCASEFFLGVALVATAGRLWAGRPADAVRIGAAVLFVVATCALIELRSSRPDTGCGCFGDFSTTPVSTRTLVRSALLAAAALATIGLPPVRIPQPATGARLLALFAAELVLIAALSPEIGESLVRLGYSEPCELRLVPAERTLASLLRGSVWRRHAALITADQPTDIWRELCWRYVVYPGRYEGREIEVVFAVYLRPSRPVVQASVVDSATAEVVAWPGAVRRRSVVRRLGARLAHRPGARVPAGSLPLSSDL